MILRFFAKLAHAFKSSVRASTPCDHVRRLIVCACSARNMGPYINSYIGHRLETCPFLLIHRSYLNFSSDRFSLCVPRLRTKIDRTAKLGRNENGSGRTRANRESGRRGDRRLRRLPLLCRGRVSRTRPDTAPFRPFLAPDAPLAEIFRAVGILDRCTAPDHTACSWSSIGCPVPPCHTFG